MKESKFQVQINKKSTNLLLKSLDPKLTKRNKIIAVTKNSICKYIAP